MVEDELPLCRMVNIVQGTDTEIEMERLERCLEALLPPSAYLPPLTLLLPWMTEITVVGKS